LVESYVKTGEALAVQESAALRSPESNQLRAVWEERDDKLGEAIAGLIYDLAVLEANSVIDLGLRGDGAAQAFRRRVEDLREQVTSEWRASCARLAITAREEDERWKAWLGALERVGRDLQSLQPYLPQPGPEAESTASGSDKAGLMNRAPKRGPRPDYEMAARIHEIVKAVAPNGNWLARLDEVCEALDEANIPCPKAWRRRDPPSRSWSTCDERAIRIKAIQYRMEQAKRATETQPKT
jgi:hypothetical protein